ncbi:MULTISPECIES: tRNA (adenosine(37)-N6)-threonylcarbamoyltransferase complex dimerization subunit type 1 TsaB [unclassified Paenibacillus]|uniref:tRNA (adenosine(37)-N6)-threonylcarbamoyltransferase complex dimerization subunit type 1 TsaB n=1 Tax=unclassified Paenibacillus TaxID=185978 RepID=UPI00095639BC|nr:MULTISPECIES: tRNA (adenosine(37)-N6)-threonylcarbamoyltransferase complex dimerization subunit type 1 TsaB [unclassified Paenibacillus]ASS68758.1 tRNA (adenosine(37)-N6)-threonylcarbamoyltransferase complex dimerization subunit type 1 TsaB [Paenibacillus sp. RUD330]SIR57064.1 tRNA threonylcarbamoyladenosine biosynthesis protein TsaB [Paenibacillus sp. RU4X]SIR65756.1 tRNA threonylcarbamoyladenosine biosynthesis protein TsaB [Paenibacillus sp. RU4T]
MKEHDPAAEAGAESLPHVEGAAETGLQQAKPREELLVLALDTSTAVLAAALMRGGEVLASVQSPAERNHSAHVVPAVQKLLADAGISPGQLDGIAAGIGPGSYTGVRIAASVAKTLAWAWKLPIVGVSTLEAMAVGAWREHAGRRSEAAASHGDAADGAMSAVAGSAEPAESSVQAGTERARRGAAEPAADRNRHSAVQESADAVESAWTVPLIDARRGQAYTALFAASDRDGWLRLETDAIRLASDWARRLYERLEDTDAGGRPERIVFTGDLEKHEESISMLESLLAGLPGGAPAVARQPHVMEGRSAAWLGSRRLAGGEADDAHAFVPNYTQLAEAEAKLLEKPGEA